TDAPQYCLNLSAKVWPQQREQFDDDLVLDLRRNFRMLTPTATRVTDLGKQLDCARCTAAPSRSPRASALLSRQRRPRALLQAADQRLCTTLKGDLGAARAGNVPQMCSQ